MGFSLVLALMCLNLVLTSQFEGHEVRNTCLFPPPRTTGRLASVSEGCGSNGTSEVAAKSCNATAEISSRAIFGDEKHKQAGSFEITALAGGLLILALTALSTGYHVYKSSQNEEPSPICTSFSLLRNIPRLLAAQPEPHLETLNGIRVLSNFLIIMMHVEFYVPRIVRSIANRAEYEASKLSFWSLGLLQQAQLGVDTFFLISGLCLANGYFSSFRRKKRFSLFQFYSHRFFRILPVMVAVVVAFVLVGNVKSGPILQDGNWLINERHCRESLWSLLLFVQNYVRPTEMCLVPTWSLCVDMQLFLLSPLLLLALRKFGYSFFPYCIASIAASSLEVYSSVVNLNLSLFDTSPDYFANIYFKTHLRFVPWLMGLMLGYVLDRQNYRFSLLKRVNPLLRDAVFLPVLFSGFIVPNLIKSITSSEVAALTHASHRILWALAMGSFVFVTSCDRRGPLNWLLSHPLWKPLVKLNYSMCLVHVPLIYLTVRKMHSELHFSSFMFGVMGLGIYGLSLLAAIPMALLIEMPFVNVENCVWRRGQKFDPKKDE